MKNWKTVKLGEVTEIVMGQSPESLFYNMDGQGIPFLQGNRTFGVKYPTFDTFTTKTTRIAKTNDVIMSVRAPVGDINITPIEFCLGRGVCSVRMKNGNNEFLYYLLKEYAKFLIQGASGTVFESVNRKDIENLDIPLPPLSEQRRIAGILGCLDAKIELNRRMNVNLEAQATALFKNWFVDFEPFRQNGMTDSPLGKIPIGWRVGSLGNLCQSISVTKKTSKEKLIFLNTGDIESGNFLHANYSEVAKMPGQAKKSIQQHDILYSEIRPINRRFAYVNFDSDDYVVSTKLMVIRAKTIAPYRLYHYLTTDAILEELQKEAESRSGTFPQIRFENISRLPIICADTVTEAKFALFLEKIYSTIEHNIRESRTLSLLRDTLLPRLMNGEI